VARPVVEVHGLRTLRRTLKAAGQSLDTDFKKVHADVADIVVVAARATAPVGPPEKGHIADSIRGSGQSAAAVIRVGRAALPYAGIVHYGDPHRKHKAQPFLLDAMYGTRERWLGVYTQGLEKIIDKIEGAPGP
jgi:HK97 gp10 family phage protein